MCGRLNVISDPLCHLVSVQFATPFTTDSNSDLCPSQTVATIASNRQRSDAYFQLNAQWGFQPSWSNKLLINAQSESAATKRTFSHVFEHYRCLVPCSGWYEWSKVTADNKSLVQSGEPLSQQAGLFGEEPSLATSDVKKRKYLFSHPESQPLYMAGVYYPRFNQNKEYIGADLITLTQAPNSQCSAYHHRMPVLIDASEKEVWFNGNRKQVQDLCMPERAPELKISPC